MKLGAACQAVAQMITDAGVPAVTDERDLNLPGALVGPANVSFEVLDATSYVAAWDVWLVTIDNGAGPALDELGDMLAKVRAVVQVDEARAQAVVLANHGADPLPALTFTLTTQITED